MITIKKIDFSDKQSIEMAFNIRKKVFVDEQKVDPALEYNRHENEANHYLVYDDDIPCGTARWRKTELGIKLERFAVLPEFRNKGIGDVLVKKILEEVVPLNTTVYLHSQLAACNLYARNGFQKEGEIFTEAGIEHYKMKLKK